MASKKRMNRRFKIERRTNHKLTNPDLGAKYRDAMQEPIILSDEMVARVMENVDNYFSQYE